MAIQVLFFGATAEIAGERKLSIETKENATAQDAVKNLISQFPSLASHRLLIAINQQYAIGNECLRDGDELAIFTPVSGG